MLLRFAGARVVDDSDYPSIRHVLSADPVASCMVAARVEAAGLDPHRLGGQLWAARATRGEPGLCFSGANLIPVSGDAAAMRAFADRAMQRRRTCSSVVGPSHTVLPLWDELTHEWGPAREVRPDQPLMATADPPRVVPDLRVRRVRPDELDAYLPAAVAMFIEEVGVDPRADDGGAAYRARVAETIAAGRAFARFEDGHVVFKAEIASLSASVGQIQGVWVHPDRRGRGLGTGGTAWLTSWLVNDLGRTASLYVNAYNTAALACYRKIGYRQVGEYATVLF